MAQVTVNRLIFDITANDRETALDFQNRLSASSDKVAACLESTLESFDDPNYHLVLDRLQLDIEALDLEHTEEDLLGAIRKTLREQLELVLGKPKDISGQDISDTVLSKETVGVYEQKQVQHFFATGHLMDHTTEHLLSATQIKTVLSDSPSVRQWFLATQEEKPEILSRLLFHLDDSDIHTLLLGPSFIDINVLTELIEAMASTDTWTREKARLRVWQQIFIQKDTGAIRFDPPVFFQSMERQYSFPPRQYISLLSQPVLHRLLPGNSDFFSPLLDEQPPSTSGQANQVPVVSTSEITDQTEKEKATKPRISLTEEPPLEPRVTAPLPGKTEPTAPVNQFNDDGRHPTTPTSPSKDSTVPKVPHPNHPHPSQPQESQRHPLEEQDREQATAPLQVTNQVLTSPSRVKQESYSNLPAAPDPTAKSESAPDSKSDVAAVYLVDQDQAETPIGTRFYLHNAGIILTAPFLATFFKHLGFLDHGQFIHEEAQQRAVVLMHYFYPQCEITENALILHKILCGLSIKHPVPIHLEPAESELREINDLLQSLIQYWNTLKNTSVESFKYNFLNRKAILIHDESQWQLTIQHESIDVLLPTLPWSIEVIKHAWMEKPIMVEW